MEQWYDERKKNTTKCKPTNKETNNKVNKNKQIFKTNKTKQEWKICKQTMRKYTQITIKTKPIHTLTQYKNLKIKIKIKKKQNHICI